MAHEQEETHQFDETKFSLLEANPNQSVTINKAEANKVTISLPISMQGQVLLAEYDQNNRFKKIISTPSNARTSVEFTFEDTSLELGSYVRAFFVGENWEPLAKASEPAMIQKSQENDHVVTGKIMIPEADDAPLKDITINLWASSDKNNISIKSTVTIQARAKEAQYQMVLAEGSYTFFYTIDSMDTPYIDGYYSSTETTNKYYLASLVDVKGNSGSIDMTLIKGHTTSGKIMIPETDDTPLQSIRVGLYASLGMGGSRSRYSTITIQAGTREAHYKIGLLEGDYILSYEVDSLSSRYAKGYYSTTGTTFSYSSASLVVVNNDVNGIDMTLIKGHLVTGKIMIPEEEVTPTENIWVQILAYSSNKSGWSSTTIQAGTREAQYQMVLPAGSYTFGYSLYDQDTPYVEGYYSTAGTTNSASSASLVVVNNDLSGIDMTLIKEQMNEHLVTGTIKIPETDQAPLQDMIVELWASSDKNNESSKYTITIQAGTREAQYPMVLAEGSYTFFYTIDSLDTPYIDGYYSSTETTNKYYLASLVDVKSDLSNIDLTLIKGHMTTGKITISETDDTPQQSINVGLYASLGKDGGRSRYSTITIQAGTREAQYQIGLPEGDYSFSYVVDTLSARYATGYYSTAGTTAISNSASLVVVNDDVSGIDMTLIKGHLVTGKIMIPEEEATPTENIWVQILASSSDKSGWGSTRILAGTREAQYQMVLPVGEYTIGYYIDNQDTHYARGYYSTTGTTFSYNSASLVIVNNDVSGIDLTLMKEQASGHLVTGRIRIPETDATPLQDIIVSLNATLDKSSSSSRYSTVTIQAGSREAHYQMVLPEGSYTFRYFSDGQDTHYANGYYSIAGTSFFSTSASLVIVDRDISNIDITLLKGHLVTGKIRIPTEEELPAESINVIVWYSLEGGNRRGYLYTIQAGTREAQYQWVLPEDNYTFSYSLYNQITSYTEGYYSTNGTTNLSNSASLVVVNNGVNGIDMTLIKVIS